MLIPMIGKIGIYTVPVLVLMALITLFGFNGLYGQDAYAYYYYSEAVRGFLNTGQDPGNFFWPVGYPVFAGILSVTGIPVSLAMQMVSIMSLLGIVYLLSRLIGFQHSDSGNQKTVYLFICFCFSPFILKAGVIGMSDLPAAFFVLAAYYTFCLYLKESNVKWALLFGIMASLSVLTRFPSIVLVALPAILIIYWMVKRKKVFHLLALSIMAVLGIMALIRFSDNSLSSLFNHPALTDWSLFHGLQREFTTMNGHIFYRFPNIVYVAYNWIHPGFMILGLILIFFIRKWDLKIYWVPLAIVGVYALFLIGIPIQNKRFLILSFPFIVLFLYPAFNRLMSSRILVRKELRYVLFGLVMLLQFSIFAYYFNQVYQLNRLEKEIAGYVKHHYAGKDIYSFSVDISFRAYGTNNTVLNLYEKKYEVFSEGNLVIFNAGLLENQWEQLNPMVNWKLMNELCELKLLHEFSNGWKLYLIQPNV